MSIEADVAPLILPSGRQAAVIDVPGHTDFLKNTIRGLNSVDEKRLLILEKGMKAWPYETEKK